MDDLRFLERSYEELTRFLRSRSASGARLLAISRFIEEIPSDLRGGKYYLEELAPAFDAALHEIDGDLRDPEVLRLADAAFEALSSAGLLPPEAVAPAALDAGTPITSGPAGHSPAQIHVVVPLVRELPPTLAQGGGIHAAGSIVEITAIPRAARWRRPKFRWNNGNVEEAVGDLRSLHDVTADALLAAKEAVTSRSRGLRRSTEPLSAVAFDFSLPEKVIPVVGDSAGLALAAAAACVYSGALKGRAPRRILPGVAWTGRVEPSGEVKPVDSVTLRAKLRAAFFAGRRTFVLPRGQGIAAAKILQSDNLAMKIIEVGHVAEIFDHETLFKPWSFPPELVRFLKLRPFRRAFRRVTVAAALLGIIYAAPWLAELAGVHFYTWWHPAPEWAKAQVELLDELYTIKVDVPGLERPIVIHESAQVAFTQIVPDLDVGGPGKVYLVYGCSWGTRDPSPGKVIAFDLEGEKPLWTYVLTSTGLPYDPWGDDVEGTLSVKTGCAGDVDGDGRS